MMKKISVVVLCLSFLAAGLTRADPQRYRHTIQGALLGAATGMIVGNNSSDIDQDIAAPLLGAVGGVVGYQMDEKDRAKRRVRRARQAEAPVVPDAPAVRAADLHPGVDLVKISIQHSNGVRTDIPLLRIKGTFIGPKGEHYDELPSTAVLTEKYGM